MANLFGECRSPRVAVAMFKDLTFPCGGEGEWRHFHHRRRRGRGRSDRESDDRLLLLHLLLEELADVWSRRDASRRMTTDLVLHLVRRWNALPVLSFSFFFIFYTSLAFLMLLRNVLHDARGLRLRTLNETRELVLSRR